MAVSLDTDKLTPGTTATSASIAARSGRFAVDVINTGDRDLYLSDVATNAGSPATTTDNSIRLAPGAAIHLRTSADIFIFTATGTGACDYLEEWS